MRHLCESTGGNIFSWGGLPMGIACYNSVGLFTDLVICALQRVKTKDKSSNLHLDQPLVFLVYYYSDSRWLLQVKCDFNLIFFQTSIKVTKKVR